MISNSDNPLPIGSFSDWHHFFSAWYGGSMLEKTKNKKTNKLG